MTADMPKQAPFVINGIECWSLNEAIECCRQIWVDVKRKAVAQQLAWAHTGRQPPPSIPPLRISR